MEVGKDETEGGDVAACMAGVEQDGGLRDLDLRAHLREVHAHLTVLQPETRGIGEQSLAREAAADLFKGEGNGH